WCTQRCADLSRFEFHDDIRQESGQFATLAPAERTPVQSRLRVRIGYCQLREVLPATSPLCNFGGAFRRVIQLLRRGGLTNPDQDVRDVVLVVFRGRAGLSRQELIDFPRRDADTLQYITLAQ